MNILLVEDDAGIGRFVSRGLAARGHEVHWERSGSPVPALVRDRRFDAALLDRGLPDADGIQLCRTLRDAGAALPILMLTASGALQDRLDGFAAGADDYLPKPFAFEELVARLDALLRRSPALAPPPLRYGSLEIDAIAREARVAGTPLRLGPREFALLSELARSAGAVVPRHRLIAQVWGEASDVSDNALDVYIGYLRRHLAPHARAPRIETVRGQGYRLDADADADAEGPGPI